MRSAYAVAAMTSIAIAVNTSGQVSAGQKSQSAGVVYGGQHQQNTTIINNNVQHKPPLRDRVNGLAIELYNFIYAHDGNPVDIQSQLIAATDMNAMRGTLEGLTQAQIDANLDKYRKNAAALLRQSHEETSLQYSTMYGGRVADALADLTSAGVDTSSLSSAIANGNIKEIAFMLSVAASRIGKLDQHHRVLTALEARAIVRGGFEGILFEVCASRTDMNSRQVAETLRKALADSNNKIGSSVRFLSVNDPSVQQLRSNPSEELKGIHMVLPSADLQFNFQSVIDGFQHTRLQYKTDVRLAPQPPTIVKIEVFPQSERDFSGGPDLYHLQAHPSPR